MTNLEYYGFSNINFIEQCSLLVNMATITVVYKCKHSKNINLCTLFAENDYDSILKAKVNWLLATHYNYYVGESEKNKYRHLAKRGVCNDYA